MKTLALDLGTIMGYAYDWNGTESGTVNLNRGMTNRFHSLESWLGEHLRRHAAIRCVAYELPHHRGGAATRLLCGLAAIVELQCDKLSVDVKPYHSGTIKKHATSSGRATKAEMLEAARKQWPDRHITDDNEADALWLLHYVTSGGAE